MALKDLFTRYALASGQIVNSRKSTIFSGSIRNARLLQLATLIGFNIGQLPFFYLGVPIFKGKPKPVYFYPLADKIKIKPGAWKVSLLSITGKVQLVKSGVQGMLIHSITTYSWPISLLKDLERCIKNFIWSGDINQRKLITVAWKKLYKTYDEGGLGVRSLIKLNESSSLKLCWNLINSEEQWEVILRTRVFRERKHINHHNFSSLWSSVKFEYSTILDNSSFIIGDGESIKFWTDIWCGSSFCEVFQIPPHLNNSLRSRVSDYIHNFQWSIPWRLQLQFPNLRQIVESVIILA